MTPHAPVPVPRIWDADYCLTRGLLGEVRGFAAEVRGDDTVLDYGCGTKPYRSLFPASCRYVGIDIVPTAHADVVIRPGEACPLPDETADALLSTQVLHKVETYVDYLSDCARLLRPRGTMLLTTHGTWTYHPATGGDFLRFTHEGLRRAIARAGFEVRDVRPLVGTLGTGLHLRQLVRTSWLHRVHLGAVASLANVATNIRILATDAMTPAGTRLSSPVALAVVAIRL